MGLNSYVCVVLEISHLHIFSPMVRRVLSMISVVMSGRMLFGAALDCSMSIFKLGCSAPEHMQFFF